MHGLGLDFVIRDAIDKNGFQRKKSAALISPAPFHHYFVIPHRDGLLRRFHFLPAFMKLFELSAHRFPASGIHQFLTAK